MIQLDEVTTKSDEALYTRRFVSIEHGRDATAEDMLLALPRIGSERREFPGFVVVDITVIANVHGAWVGLVRYGRDSTQSETAGRSPGPAS